MLPHFRFQGHMLLYQDIQKSISYPQCLSSYYFPCTLIKENRLKRLFYTFFNHLDHEAKLHNHKQLEMCYNKGLCCASGKPCAAEASRTQAGASEKWPLELRVPETVHEENPCGRFTPAGCTRGTTVYQHYQNLR